MNIYEPTSGGQFAPVAIQDENFITGTGYAVVCDKNNNRTVLFATVAETDRADRFNIYATGPDGVPAKLRGPKDSSPFENILQVAMFDNVGAAEYYCKYMPDPRVSKVNIEEEKAMADSVMDILTNLATSVDRLTSQFNDLKKSIEDGKVEPMVPVEEPKSLQDYVGQCYRAVSDAGSVVSYYKVIAPHHTDFEEDGGLSVDVYSQKTATSGKSVTYSLRRYVPFLPKELDAMVKITNDQFEIAKERFDTILSLKLL